MKEKRGEAKGYLSMHNEISPHETRRGNLAYQARQLRRQSYLEKKRTLRRIFEIGKLIEKVGFENEDFAVIYGCLLDAKEQLQNSEAETTRQKWRIKGEGLSKEKF